MNNNPGLKGKHCVYTFALSDLEQAERIISELPDFDTYAYIKHNPDDENGHIHYHFYIQLKQPLSIQSLANKLMLPPFMIEWVRNKTKMIQYLIHKNNPEKIQYLPDDIVTNNRELINRFLFPSDNKSNISSEFSDLLQVSNGLLTPQEFVNQHFDSLSNLSFYSRSLYFMRLINLSKEDSPKKRYF